MDKQAYKRAKDALKKGDYEAASDEHLNGDVFLHLACAELAYNNRKRAIEMIQLGMKIDPCHVRLKRACTRM